jgi:NAD(P)-dependent dehydrogenase (short-subunit alcohol dehydrogenase family)
LRKLRQTQVILITGGGTGLGRYMAEGFAENGAKVYITGRRMEVLQKTAAEVNEICQGKGEVIPIQGDVSTKASVKALVDEVAARENKVRDTRNTRCDRLD